MQGKMFINKSVLSVYDKQTKFDFKYFAQISSLDYLSF